MNQPRHRQCSAGLRTGALALCLLSLVSRAQGGGFVYETARELHLIGDFNGDGQQDFVVVDKDSATYRNGLYVVAGQFAVDGEVPTGLPSVSMAGAGPLFTATKDAIAAASEIGNRIHLIEPDAPQNSPLPVYAAFGGPDEVAVLDIPGGTNTALEDLFTGSNFDIPMARGHRQLRNTAGVFSVLSYDVEPTPQDSFNTVVIGPAQPDMVARMVRDLPMNTFHVDEVDETGLSTTLTRPVPDSSSYAYGKFDAPLHHFLFYVPGTNSGTAVPVEPDGGGGFQFGTATNLSFSGNVSLLTVIPDAGGDYIVALAADGTSAEIFTFQSGTGLTSLQVVNAATLPGLLSGAVPMPDGTVQFLTAPALGQASTAATLFEFSGGSFAPVSTATFPATPFNRSLANVFLYEYEPFVDPDAILLRTLRLQDWTSSFSLTGAPGDVIVTGEVFANPDDGLFGPLPVNLGPAHLQTTHGLTSQIHDTISVFAYDGVQGDLPELVTVSPPAGNYPAAVQIQFHTRAPTTSVYYRTDSSDPFQQYTVPFAIVVDSDLQFFGVTTGNAETTPVKTSSYQFSNAPPMQDSDADLVPDFVEASLGTLDSLSDDTDGDGYSDLDELLAGSDPNDHNNIPGSAAILLVTNDNTDTQSLTDFLEANAHTVTRGNFESGIPSPAVLDDHDLIIIARETMSNRYDDGTEPQDWNGITKPLINMSPNIMRLARWGWYNGDFDTNVNVTAFDAPLPDPGHPIFAGLQTTTQMSVATTGDCPLASQSLPAGATVVATHDNLSHYGIFTIPAGATMFGGAGTAGDWRIGYLRGDDASWDNASLGGERILLNMIDFALGQTAPRPDTAAALRLDVNPRPYNGFTAAEIDAAEDQAIRCHDPVGTFLATGKTSTVFHVQPTAALEIVPAEPLKRFLVLSTEKHYRAANSPAPPNEENFGREIVGLVPISDGMPVDVPFTYNPLSPATQPNDWITAAQGVYGALTFPPVAVDLNRFHTLKLVLLERMLTVALEQRAGGPLDPVSLTPFRFGEDSASTTYPNLTDLLALEQPDGPDPLNPPSHLLRSLYASLESAVDSGSPTSGMTALRDLTTEIYRVSCVENNTNPATYGLPLDILRTFIHTGVLAPPYDSDVTLTADDLAAASAEVASLVSAMSPRPVINLTLEVPPGGAVSDVCTAMQTPGGATTYALVDAGGAPFPLPDAFHLVDGSGVLVSGFTDVAPSCGFPAIEVLSAELQFVPFASESDLDGNCLPDAWEELFFGQPGTIEPFASPDGSGYSALQQFLDGTDPTDPSSVPAGAPVDLSPPTLTIDELPGGSIHLTWDYPAAYAEAITFCILESAELQGFSDTGTDGSHLGGGQFEANFPATVEARRFFTAQMKLAVP